MKLRLTITSYQRVLAGESAVMRFGREGGTIGRAPTCTWALPDPTRTLSGRHAQLGFANGGFTITDTSTNGTYLNGDEEPLGKAATAPLRSGDRLELGPYTFQVAVEQEEAADAIPLPAFNPLDLIKETDASAPGGGATIAGDWDPHIPPLPTPAGAAAALREILAALEPAALARRCGTDDPARLWQLYVELFHDLTSRANDPARMRR